MIEAPSVIAIILAAGLSRRFGEADKLLAGYRGQPLVTHAAALALALPFRAVLAVCRADSDVPAVLTARGVEVHINARTEEGMGSSLAIGARAASRLDPAACLILLGDMPGVTVGHLEALLDAFDANHDIVTSAAGGRRMPPTLFGKKHFPQLLDLGGDQGARQLTQQARVVEVGDSVLKDIDLPDDLLGL